jgi:alkylresorcinol/alkylpyrone synthase
MQILSVGTAQPPHYYDQETLLAAFQRAWTAKHHNPRRVEQLHRAVMVGGRHLALPMERYESMSGFGESNGAFIEVGTDIGEAAILDALAQAGLKPTDIDAIFFASVTGISAPSIDAKLVNRLGLRSDVKRIPIFGLGCVAGAAGTARLYDYLRAWPDQVAVLLTVELCSLTLQVKDFSIPNLIASGLFGDGAAAVLAAGTERAATLPARGPAVTATRSRFYPDSEGVMGWDITERGFGIVLTAGVPAMVERHIREDVDGFLEDHGLTRADIGCWVCHTGGPKVLTAFQSALEVDQEALELTWTSLREVGNLSSASVLYVLRDTIAQRKPPAGTPGMMLAMGPGFCSELVLMEW